MSNEQNKPLKSSSTASHRVVDVEELVRAHIGWMLALAERLLRDPDRAKDAVQEAFVAAFKGLGSFEGRSDIKTWLHRITVNASLAVLRKTKQLSEESIDELLPQFDQLNCRIETPWTELSSLQELVERTDLREQVKTGIDQLPPSYRIVVQLRDIEGYSTNEVASILELTDANVKVRLHRARAALKKLLEPTLRGESTL